MFIAAVCLMMVIGHYFEGRNGGLQGFESVKSIFYFLMGSYFNLL